MNRLRARKKRRRIALSSRLNCAPTTRISETPVVFIMAKIDALLGHMTQRGATRALLQADAPATLETEAGTTQGAPLSGAQLQSMLDEIMPAAARQNLIDNGRADFTYTAPSGPFNVRVAQPNGKWHLEVQPATAPSATSPQTTIAPTIETVKTGAPAVNTARPGPPAFDPLGTNAPPPSPPVTAQQPAPYAPPPGQAGAAGANYQNNSGMGEASVLPAELQGFSWAGLFGSWIWGLGNNVWIGLLCLVPCLGFFMRFYLGARGNEMAWKSKQWESVQAFRSAQTLWGVLGGVATAGALVFLVIPAAIVFPVFARGQRKRETLGVPVESETTRSGRATVFARPQREFSHGHHDGAVETAVDALLERRRTFRLPQPHGSGRKLQSQSGVIGRQSGHARRSLANADVHRNRCRPSSRRQQRDLRRWSRQMV